MRLYFITLFCCLLLYACSYQTHLHSNSYSLTFSQPKVDVRVVKHFMGETIVPAHPQRVMVLLGSLLEPAFALGVKPIAAPKDAVSDLQRLVGKLRGIELVDWPSPNLEKLLQLKPDLILGFSSHEDIYPLLSHIAPTVLATFNPVAPWKEFLAFTARALGKTKEEQQLMADYYARLAHLRASMGQHLLSTVVLSVAELRSTELILAEKASFAGTILLDAGIKIPPNQLLDPQTSIRLGGRAIVYPLSNELLCEIDGNILFLVTEDSVGDQDLNPAIKQFQPFPLWSKLKVVQLHRVHQVGFYWKGSGSISANRAINDLFKYLLNSQF